jgi:hypothetical protein
MEKKVTRIITLFLILSALVFSINLISYFFRSFINSALYKMSSLGLALIVVFLSLFLIFPALLIWRSTHINKWIQWLFDSVEGYWRILVLLFVGLVIDLSIYGLFIFASFRPTATLLIITSSLVIFKLALSGNQELSSLYPGLCVFIIEIPLIVFVQKFLFPLESYWILLLFGLFLYGVIEWLLIKGSLVANLFMGLDHGNVRIIDCLLLLLFPLILSTLFSLLGQGMFLFFLPVLLLICLFHSCMTVVASYFLEYIQNFQINAGHKMWFMLLVAVFLIYMAAFFSLKTYPPSYPLFEGGNNTKGTWFTIPVNKSDLFPYGYGRLEDSLFDDLGKPFMAALGQTFGLVEKCKFPGPDTSVVLASPDKNLSIQPRYLYAVDSMCIQWINSISGFYLRIGVLGLFLLALVIGVIVKDPIDFGILSVIFLFAWFTWPVSDIYRTGNVSALISGMAFIGLILPLLRRNRGSFLIIWGITSGFVFGMAGLIRQPCGYALFVTAMLILVFAGMKQKKFFAMLITSVSLLAGYNIMPATLNGLFMYRDNKLQITAPSISPRSHGSGFPLLGGIGGLMHEDPPSPEFKNQLDIAFRDPIIFFILYNENPLISFPQNSHDNLMYKTADSMFGRYLSKNLIEYINISLQKIYRSFVIMINAPKNWLFVSAILLFAMGIRYVLSKKIQSNTYLSINQIEETLFAFIVLVIVAIMPAALTSPYYGESTYPSSAVFLFTVIITIYMICKYLMVRRSSKKTG